MRPPKPPSGLKLTPPDVHAKGLLGILNRALAPLYWFAAVIFSAVAALLGYDDGALDYCIGSFVSTLSGLIAVLFKDATVPLNPVVGAVADAISTDGPVIKAQYDKIFTPLVTNAFAQFTKTLAENKTTDPLLWAQPAVAALEDAVKFGLSSYATTVMFETLLPEKLNTLNAIGPILATLAGFEEIVKRILGPQLDASFGRLAGYQANADNRTKLPSGGDGLELFARRISVEADIDPLLGFEGINVDWVAALKRRSYRPVSPRALATAFVDAPFPRDDVKLILDDNAIYPDAEKILLDALEARSTQNVRAQYLNAVLTAAEGGVFSDSDVDSALNDLGFSQQASHFVKLTVAVKRLKQLEVIYRRSISASYKFGLISDADYIPHLTAIGLGQADAEAHYALDSIEKNGRALVAQEREQARAAAKLQALSVRAAIASYDARQIDAPALAGGLTAAGVDPASVALLVEIASARRDARQVFAFGVYLDAADAAHLREQVAVLKAEVSKKLTDPDAAFARLLALSIPRPNATALVEAWAATYLKTLWKPIS